MCYEIKDMSIVNLAHAHLSNRKWGHSLFRRQQKHVWINVRRIPLCSANQLSIVSVSIYKYGYLFSNQ